jgi:hypothetical protein
LCEKHPFGVRFSSSLTRPFQFRWGPCTDEYSLLYRPFILNGVLARPSITKFSHTLSRTVDALNRFDKMQVSVALHLENPKWYRQENSASEKPIAPKSVHSLA